MAQIAAGMYTRLNRQKNKSELLEGPVFSRNDDGEHQQRNPQERQPLGNVEERHGLHHADVFGDQGQPVDQRQVEDGEPAPKRTEGVENGLGMTTLGDGAQTHGHFLDVVGHGYENDERPKQIEPGF